MSPSPRPIRLVHLATALMLAAAMGGCGRSTGSVPGASTAQLPDQEVSDFVMTETDAGAQQWTLHARSAAIYNARSVVHALGVRIDFFDEQGKRSSTLTAREGEMHQGRRDMVARGDVVLQTAEGTRMSTEELQFLNRQQRIVSNVFVRVERHGDVLTGIGFESDPELRHFEFKRQVQAVVRTRSGGAVESRGGDR